MTTVLVTGTSGFVGSAVGRHLRQQGWTVLGLSRGPSRPGVADRHIHHDLRQPLPASTPTCEAVVHAAALSSPWANPADYTDHIVTATDHILDYVALAGVGRLVHISSSAVYYTRADQYDISEDTPLPATPINAYAGAKREADARVTMRCPDGLVLRPRAVYGPGDTVLFPRILRAARRRLLPRLERADGTEARSDLIYIGNLAHAVERALEIRVGGVINVTDGSPVVVQAVLADILGRLGYAQPRLRLSVDTAMRLAAVMEWTSARFLNWREPPLTRFGVATLTQSKTFDVSRMRALLGAPVHTTAEGLDAFVHWHRRTGGS